MEEMEDNLTKATRKDIFMRLVDMEDVLHNKVFLDQTGTFPYQSSKGMRYMMVMLEYDSNYIMVEACKTRWQAR